MAKYTINWAERKTTKVGDKFDAALKDEQGVETTGVTLWAKDWPDAQPGREVEGDLVVKQNGQYTNKTLYKAKTWSAGRAAAKPDFTKIVEQKNENITRQMDRKEDSIKIAGAQRDATLMVTTFFHDGFHTDEELKTKWLSWKSYFLGQSDSPF